MDVLISVYMPWFAEPEFEYEIFARIAGQIEPECIQPLRVKDVWRREAHVRIDGHRHHGCARSTQKQIKITYIKARIFSGEFGVEMM
jgi:hypothetical protein